MLPTSEEQLYQLGWNDGRRKIQPSRQFGKAYLSGYNDAIQEMVDRENAQENRVLPL